MPVCSTTLNLGALDQLSHHDRRAGNSQTPSLPDGTWMDGGSAALNRNPVKASLHDDDGVCWLTLHRRAANGSNLELVCASNLDDAVLRQRLDPDLYDRVSHLSVRIPPIRACWIRPQNVPAGSRITVSPWNKPPSL